MDSIKPSNRKDTLFLFTNEFPYGNGESFIESELSNHLKYFKTVKIFPLLSFGSSRPIDDRIVIVDLFNQTKYSSFRILFENFYFILKILSGEFYNTKSKIAFLKQFRTLLSVLLRNIKRSEILSEYIKKERELTKIVFYSFWTDDWATVMSILKKKNRIPSFISRVHGYDLYVERWPDKIIPFRELQFENVSKVFAVSKYGLEYLIHNQPKYKNKFRLNHLSIFDNGIAHFDDEIIFTITSCSNLIPLKRVHLIAETLCEIDFPIRWIHFGNGIEFQKIKTILEGVKLNVKYHLVGEVANSEVIKFYKNNNVNLFVHLSESEGGVPLSLQEAASFGIPLLGSVAGGSSEIINNKTGIPLPVDFQKNQLKSLIENFKNSEKNKIEFRKNVRAFWLESFSANSNYYELYKHLCE